MNDEQRAALRKLAEKATPVTTELYGDRYYTSAYSCALDITKEQDDFIAAANPSAILQLLDYIETLEKDAAQQRTAEACAKAVERLISGDGICADNEVWIHDCADAIRRGDWRDHL